MQQALTPLPPTCRPAGTLFSEISYHVQGTTELFADLFARADSEGSGALPVQELARLCSMLLPEGLVSVDTEYFKVGGACWRWGLSQAALGACTCAWHERPAPAHAPAAARPAPPRPAPPRPGPQVMLHGCHPGASLTMREFMGALDSCMLAEQAVLALAQQQVLDTLEQACQYLISSQVRGDGLLLAALQAPGACACQRAWRPGSQAAC